MDINFIAGMACGFLLCLGGYAVWRLWDYDHPKSQHVVAGEHRHVARRDAGGHALGVDAGRLQESVPWIRRDVKGLVRVDGPRCYACDGWPPLSECPHGR